eukprot:m.11313 g.11313  ORF g.11313 m.11313 type:complete len:93 (+) comp9787_c0_seq1:283-561(+)
MCNPSEPFVVRARATFKPCTSCHGVAEGVAGIIDSHQCDDCFLLEARALRQHEVEQGILAVCYVPALPRWHDRIRARTASLRNHAVSKVLRF